MQQGHLGRIYAYVLLSQYTGRHYLLLHTIHRNLYRSKPGIPFVTARNEVDIDGNKSDVYAIRHSN